MKLIKYTDKIWLIDNFLSEKDCDDLMFFSEQRGYEEATVSIKGGPKMIKGIRNNSRLVYEDQNLASKYWVLLKEYCPKEIDGCVSVGLNEQFRFYKYESRQRFKRHIDGRFVRNESEESRITFMIYLNDDFIGGETTFDDFVINPKAGSALCFIHEQKHEGCPVIEGIKYVLRSDVMYRTVSK